MGDGYIKTYKIMPDASLICFIEIWEYEACLVQTFLSTLNAKYALRASQ